MNQMKAMMIKKREWEKNGDDIRKMTDVERRNILMTTNDDKKSNIVTGNGMVDDT